MESSKQSLPRRSLPKTAQRPIQFDSFETRLALSANVAAAALIDALDGLQPVGSSEISGVCHPAANSQNSHAHSGNADLNPEPTGALVWGGANHHGNAGQLGVSELGSGNTGDHEQGGLLSQAAAIRDRWQLTGSGQTVAVIDSGIAWDHVALGSGFGPGYRVVGGWDFAEQDANPYDDPPAGFHGTHVGGLLAGESDRLTGVAPGADLVGIRVFDDHGQSSLDWIESALRWVYDNRDSFEHPLTTVNLSLGATIPAELADQVQAQFADELADLHAANIVVVAAAGNQFNSSRADAISFPASSDLVWAVGSTDSSGDLSQFSQREDQILATVGRNLTSSIPDHVLGWDGNVDDYYAATGTSMAAPQMAGAAVLLREAFELVGQEASNDTLLNILQSTATTRTDLTTGFSYYDVDLEAAIEFVFAQFDAPGDEPGNGTDNDSGGSEAEDPTDDPWEPLIVDLGRVQWESAVLDGNTALHVTAVSDGIFSLASDTPPQTPIRITDLAGNLLWDGTPTSNNQIDLDVRSDQTLVISTPQASSETRLQLANVLLVDQGQVNIDLGAHNPAVSIDLSNGFTAQIGSLNYQFSSGQFGNGDITAGIINGGAGADQLSIIGSAAAGRLILNPYADGSLSEGDISLVLRGFEEVNYRGGGGADRVFLHDTFGDDRLEARPGQAVLTGVGFRYEVSEISRSYIHATAGGNDVAFLYDSAGDERLAVRPQFVSLRGGDFFNLAFGFERVFAYASAGGHDTADLYDSAGDDRFSASSSNALITGPGYFVQARHFQTVTGHATAGGNDLATMYSDGDAQSRWIRTDDQITLRSATGDNRVARGFEQVSTFVAGAPVEVEALGWEHDEPSPQESEPPTAINSRTAWITLPADEPSERQPAEATAATMAEFLAISRDHQRAALDSVFAEA
ncbi:S8 family peptidase [Planctomycetaceae bacterium SH139]